MNETSANQDHTDILMRITLVCIAITAGISGIAIAFVSAIANKHKEEEAEPERNI